MATELEIVRALYQGPLAAVERELDLLRRCLAEGQVHLEKAAAPAEGMNAADGTALAIAGGHAIDAYEGHRQRLIALLQAEGDPTKEAPATWPAGGEWRKYVPLAAEAEKV